MAVITAANARTLAAKSHETRRRNIAEREAQKNSPTPAPQAVPQTVPPDEFTARRLTRVREQLSRLDDMIAKETDATKLDRLASAQSRLAEQERLLAGRPLPGSFRPATEKATGRRSVLAPASPQPSQPFEPRVVPENDDREQAG